MDSLALLPGCRDHSAYIPDHGNCPATARTLQGMARVRSGQAPAGSLLAALDVHPRVAMQILRHSKIAVTMEIYTEVPSAATRAALLKLSQWLGS